MKRMFLLVALAVVLVFPVSASAATVDVTLEPSGYCLTVHPDATESGDFMSIVIKTPSGRRYKALTTQFFAAPWEWRAWCVPVADYEAAGGFGWTYTVKLDHSVVAEGTF